MTSKIVKISHLTFQIIIANLFFSNYAYAYFDHGTGSLLVQSAIAFFGMIMLYLHRIKTIVVVFFQKMFGKKHLANTQEQNVTPKNKVH